jgi:hypothetical protein
MAFLPTTTALEIDALEDELEAALRTESVHDIARAKCR